MPVKRKRNLYKLPFLNDGGDLVVKMKESHAELLGLDPLESDDPLLVGTFASGPSQGKKFLKNAGGYRFESFRLVAKTHFTVNEQSGEGPATPVEVKSIDIGLPKGAAVNQIMSWVADLTIADTIEKVITPKGIGRGVPTA